MLPPEFLLGKDESVLTPIEEGGRIKVHRDVLASLRGLSEAAATAGFSAWVVSGFRGYDHQMRIWNEKARGLRPVHDEDGNIVAPYTTEAEKEARFFYMLRWSAFPGLSRHHWGSDMDVVDKAAMPPGYQVQLTPNEVEGDGLFAPFHDWLDGHLKRFGFFRPYQTDRGGVSPERWHLSYAPLSQRCLKDFSPELFRSVVDNPQVEMSELARQHQQLLWDKYFQNIDFP